MVGGKCGYADVNGIRLYYEIHLPGVHGECIGEITTPCNKQPGSFPVIGMIN